MGAPRDRIMDLLRTQHGLSTRAVAKGVGVTESTADYHLRRLRREQRVLAEEAGREVRWFATPCGLCPVLRQAIPAMRRAPVASVALALSEWPLTSRAVAERAGVPLGQTRQALPLLERIGIVERSRTGRVALRDGAALCVPKAIAGERCALWGACPMSRSLTASR